jgi:hypothetical protein
MLASILQKAGFKPGRSLHLSIPKLLLAATVAGGAVSLLGAGSARATTWKSTCTFGILGECTGASGTGWTTTKSPINPPATAPGNPPLQLGDKLLNIITYSFANGIGNPAPTGHFDFEWQDSDTPTVFGDDNWNLRTVFDNALSGLLPTPANDAVGFLNYTLEIVGSSATFKNAQVDGSTTGSGNTVIKSIVSPAVTLTSINGGISNVNIGGTFLNVTDTYRVTNTGGLNSFNNGFTQNDIPPVPGPLPLMGAGMALGFSRKLRSRIKGSVKA